MSKRDLSLIVTIVRKGWGDCVLEESMKAGASGGTIMLGRGTGIHEQQKLLGMIIEPEKEIIFSVVPVEKQDVIMEAIIKSAQLDKPGTGISFVFPLEKAAGIIHSLI